MLAIASDSGTQLLKITQHSQIVGDNKQPEFRIDRIRLEDNWKTFAGSNCQQSTMSDVASRQVSFNSNGTAITSVTSSGEILIYQNEPERPDRWVAVHREEIN